MVEKCDEAMAKALEAHTLATIAATREQSHEQECARRYEDWRRSNDQLRTEISESNKEMRDTVSGVQEKVGKAITDFTTAVQASIVNANEATNKKVGGLYVILLSSAGGLILCMLGAILTYVFTHKP